MNNVRRNIEFDCYFFDFDYDTDTITRRRCKLYKKTREKLRNLVIL